MNERWRVTLLGGLRAERETGHDITRFYTYKYGALLAYLAFYRDRAHPREALIEMLWPEAGPKQGRNSLSQALSSLRHQLEPPGTPARAVLRADRFSLSVNPAALTTDVAEFEEALQAAARGGAAEPQESLARALALYRGKLLPGYYEGWILGEQERLSGLYIDATGRLITLLEEAGDVSSALTFARRAVSVDPHHEEGQRHLIRLLAVTGQPGAALRQYKEYERLLDELGDEPPAALRALARRIEKDAGFAASLVLPAVAPTPAPVPAPGRRGGAPSDVPAAGGAPGAAPPPSLLPLTFTRFFGRESEIGVLTEMLSDPQTRLVTLTGPGGTGKTRLAIELARRIRDLEGEARFVAFAPLAELADPGLTGGAILEALRLPRSPQREPLEQAAEFLATRPNPLLVLDNFEHLLGDASAAGLPGGGRTRDEKQARDDQDAAGAAARLVQTLLERVPSLRLLVTSRRLLSLPAEREFALSPLPTPNGAQSGDTPEQLSLCDSVRLFIDRAQTARPDFQVTSHNAPAVAQLCDRLEGIPLAIELAAARAQVLTPAQMLAQLSDRFAFLTSRRRDVGERQRTLRGAVDWSYRLLAPDLRRFFWRLSVFRGGWGLEAAEAVCEEPLALDHLAQLRDCSLVLTREDENTGEAGEMRFSFLETLREFAQQQVPDEEREPLSRRHSEFYLRVAEEQEEALLGSRQARVLDQLAAEQDNFRAALDWCAAGTVRADTAGRTEIALRLAGALAGFWRLRGHWAEGRRRLDGAIASGEAEEHAPARAKALIGAATLAKLQSDFEQARAAATESLRLYREIGDARGTGNALNNLSLIARSVGEFAEALAAGDEALARMRECGDEDGMAVCLGNLMVIHAIRGDYAAARSLGEEGLALYRKGNPAGVASALNNLGLVAQSQGDYPAARKLVREALDINRTVGDRAGQAINLNALGTMAEEVGDYADAESLYAESLAIDRELGNRRGVAISLHNLGILAADRSDLAAARRFFSESAQIDRELGARSTMAEALAALGVVAMDQGDLAEARGLLEESLAVQQEAGNAGEIASGLLRLGALCLREGNVAAAKSHLRDGLTRMRAQAALPQIAGALHQFAALAVAEGDHERAARLLAAAERLRGEMGTRASPREGADPVDLAGAARAALGEAAFGAAREAGSAMSHEQAVAYALEELP